jgi:hypothetical protein
MNVSIATVAEDVGTTVTGIQTATTLYTLVIVVMVAALDAGAGPEIVTWPMLLAGLGIGALASQLGAVTMSSMPSRTTTSGTGRFPDRPVGSDGRVSGRATTSASRR